jgi:hypothetical protein
VTFSPGWRRPALKCPACHQVKEHEQGCPYEQLSIPRALEQFHLDRLAAKQAEDQPDD